MDFVIYAVFMIIGGTIGRYLLPFLWDVLPFQIPAYLDNAIANVVIGALIFLLIAIPAKRYVYRTFAKIENFLSNLSVSYIIFGILGLILGLILSWLINLSLVSLNIPIISDILPIVVTVTLATLFFRLGTSRREEIRRLFSSIGQSSEDKDGEVMQRKADDNYHEYKVLDTSVIIDGRIYEVVKTGFLEGTLVIPNFVLRELQHIADSSDSLKRERGRRGLDILNDLQEEEYLPVMMYDGDIDEVDEVDEKLVVLTKKIDGILVTNDYNLNKVAEFRNVQVLNVNELANAVKPVVIPGESMKVTIVKEGTERSQGVAYLSDGTMIVVEDGKFYMNESISVIVTSSLQTSAGRMIFAKPEHSTKTLDEK